MKHNSLLPLPEEVIPHRNPHLWLSGVVDVDPGARGHGFWLPSNEHFDGHFENKPILMAVKQLEALAQLGSYIMMVESDKPLVGMFKSISDVKFPGFVKPGQTLGLFVEIVGNNDKRDFVGHAVATVDDKVTCEATIEGTLMAAKLADRLLGQIDQ